MTDASQETIIKRPFFLSILCIAIFVYAGFLAALFLFALLFNIWVTITLEGFFPEKNLITNNVILISIIGLILNIVSIFGAIFLWKLRRKGFYIYLFSNLIFILLPFFIGYGNIYSSTILVIMLLLITIFYRKLK